MVTIPESHIDIVQRSQVVILATEGTDGHPQVTAVWFLVDDGNVKMSLNSTRQKTRNLQRNPQATLFFLDPDNPYRTVEIRVRARLEPDPEYVLADRVAAKYGGGTDLRKADGPGEHRVAVTFETVKVNTFG